jgi:hypothetical protein
MTNMPLENDLENRLQQIEARNARVEIDKAWETSLTRKALLILFTYLAIGLYMRAINVSQPWLNAIIPAAGFLLSTLTLPFVKRIWIRRNNKVGHRSEG